MSLKSKFRAFVALITVVCFSASSFAKAVIPSGYVESLFHYARTNQVQKIRYLIHDMGYDIDAENEQGDTAYCMAKEKNNTYAMDVLERFGANSKQRCGQMPWGVIGTVAGVAAVGGIAAAAGGGGGGGSDDSCKDVVCAENSHCVKGVCECDEGYGKYKTQQCHETKECVNGVQYGPNCLCDKGSEGPTCADCSVGYEKNASGGCEPSECAGFELDNCDETTTECSPCYSGEITKYKISGCKDGYELSADGQSCVNAACDGFDKDVCPDTATCSYCLSGTETKYKVDRCNVGYTGDDCDTCDTGYIKLDDGCYIDLNCENNSIGSTGKQIGNSCECNKGYTGQVCNKCDKDLYYDHYETSECHLKLECKGGKQQGAVCVCETGYTGALCNKCDTGYSLINGACEETLNCGEHGQQVGNICVCEDGYGRDKTGACVPKSAGEFSPDDDANSNYVNKDINTANYDYIDVAGKKYDDDPDNPSGNIKGNQHDLYLSYIDLNSYVNIDQPVDSSAKITINNLGDGNAYGLKSENASNIFLSYLSLNNFNYSREGTENVGIFITNGDKIEGTKDLYTGGNGDVYGVYGGTDTDLYALAQFLENGAVIDTNQIDRTAKINIKSIGSGDIYGMYGQADIYNTLFNITSFDSDTNIYSGDHYATQNATIDVESTGSGNVYGIYSIGGGEVVNGGVIEATSNDGSAFGIYIDNTTGTVETISDSNITVESTGSGDAYGIYDWGASTITHKGSISATVQSGDAYGVYLEGNSRNLTTYADSRTIKVGEKLETVNSIITATGNGSGNAYGIYDEGGSTINHNGSISATNKDGNASGTYLNNTAITTGEKSTITATNTGSGNAYGMEGYGSANITHNGSITAVAAGFENDSGKYGNAYGAFMDGLEFTMNTNSAISAINNGFGNSYGVYAFDGSDITINGGTISAIAEQLEDETFESNISGDTYGIYVSEYETLTTLEDVMVSSTNNGSGNAYGVYSNNIGEISHNGSISASAVDGGAFGTYLNNTAITTGENSTITATATGTGSAYGIYDWGASTITNTGTITAISAGGVKEMIVDPDTGSKTIYADAYGISSNTGKIITNYGSTISATNTGSGNAYGIYGESMISYTKDDTTYSGITTGGSIDVTTENGDAYGIYGKDDSTINNTGTIMAKSVVGKTYGVVLHNSMIENNGTINVGFDPEDQTDPDNPDTPFGIGDVYGIYGLNGSTINHNGSISATAENGNANGTYLNNTTITTDANSTITATATGTGSAYGIYDWGASTIIHNGSISATVKNGHARGIDIDASQLTMAEDSTVVATTTETGDAYGIYDWGASTITHNGSISATAEKDGSAFGIYVYEGGSTINHNGSISATAENGNANGAYLNASTFTVGVGSSINVKSAASSGVSYGIKNIGGIVELSEESDNKATISVENTGGGDVRGIESDTVNLKDADIEVLASSSNGGAYGILTKNGSMEDSVVNVGSSGSAAAGIVVKGGKYNIEDSEITVEGNTEKEVCGVYVSDEGSVTTDFLTTISVVNNNKYGKAYGIYATDSSTVTNRGTIRLGSRSCSGPDCKNNDDILGNDKYIEIDGTSLFTNLGILSSSYDLNFDNMGGGTIALGKGGVYEATSLKGTMAVDSSVVEEGFDDTYVEKEALKSSEIDVKVASKSAMFEAKVEKNKEKDSANVVMTRKSFAELSSSSSIAEFLEQNYGAKNNSVLFSNLKKADTSSYAKTEAELLGYSLLPNFAQENMSVLRNLNATLTDELFKTKGAERKMVGYDHLYRARDTKGTLTGYENYANTMYFMYDVEGDNLIRKGFGMGITQFRSDYDDDSDRKDLMVQAFVPVSYINDKGMSFASIARFGYSDGEYERHTSDGMYESDLTSWSYGLSNAVRYGFDFGGLIVEPTAEFNVLGYYQNRIRENNNKAMSIKADAENNLSVEMGLGVNLRKDVKLNEHSSLSFNANAMYYHEFAKPYHSLEASMYGMEGKYVITDYENIYDRDRAMLSLGLDYNYKPFTFYGKFKQFIEDENPFEANMGIKYNF